MMGVSSKDAFLFMDAYNLFPLTISQEVKLSMIKTILNTVIMEKTLKQWFEHFVKEGNKKGVKFCYNTTGNPALDYLYTRPYNMDDFNFDRIERPNVNILIELILQNFYKKEFNLCSE